MKAGGRIKKRGGPPRYDGLARSLIYLTILNVPRGIRSKQENTILVGIIPGSHEPRHDLNTYLKPLVADLLKQWNGMQLIVAGVNCRKIIHSALVCVACDLPAGRNVCGYLGHNTHLGCSLCYKKFSGSVGTMDFSGFDRKIG